MDDCLQEHGLNIDWTLGPLDYFLDHSFKSFFEPFFLLDHFITGGGADHKCLGRGGRQAVVTEGGVQDGLVERR